MVVAMGVKLQRHALGVTWVEQNAMARAAHALVDVRRVWLIDPYEDTEALAAVAELGTPAGVLQLLDRQRGKHVLPPVDQARAFARGCRTNTHRSRFVVTKSNGLISPEVKSLQGGARLPRDGRTRLRPGGTRRAIWRFSRGPTFVRQPPWKGAASRSRALLAQDAQPHGPCEGGPVPACAAQQLSSRFSEPTADES